MRGAEAGEVAPFTHPMGWPWSIRATSILIQGLARDLQHGRFNLSKWRSHLKILIHPIAQLMKSMNFIFDLYVHRMHHVSASRNSLLVSS